MLAAAQWRLTASLTPNRLIEARDLLETYLRETSAIGSEAAETPDEATFAFYHFALLTGALPCAEQVTTSEKGWAASYDPACYLCGPSFFDYRVFDARWVVSAHRAIRQVARRALRRVKKLLVYLVLRTLERPKRLHEFIASQRSWHLLHGAHPPRMSGSFLSPINLLGASPA